MKKNAFVFIFFVIYLISFAQYKKYSFQQPKMGSPFNIIIYSTDSVSAEKAALQTFRLIDTLNEIYSDYLPTSELNRLCARSGSGEWIKVSEPLFTILKTACSASKISSGSFDITISPAIRLWRAARKQKKLPNPDSLAAAMKKVSYKFIEISFVNKSVRLKKAGMQLDLGGIAKGETAQRALIRLRTLGFPFSLIDAGGDLVAGDTPPSVEGWKVSINLPESEELMEQQLLLRNTAVATSGDLYQYLDVNGVRYSHIVDPATGWAITNSRNVTVISKDGTNADWLTKACSILPVKKAMRLVSQFPATELQIAVLKNQKPFYYRSTGFKKRLLANRNSN
ncbi:MAG: FAD:protein FMN transferase [Flavisolibacter sp.]